MMVLLRSWILFCACLVALGWVLSIFAGLASAAYEIALVLLVLFWLVHALKLPKSTFRFRPVINRLTSPRLLLPGLFALSAALLLFKGLVTPPFHDDGLCYRIPRAMHWILDHRWHWIDAEDVRLDVCGTVSEWLTVPILLIFHTDRLVFLPNWICHLFLPGLIFSVWRNLGASPKVAWIAMWLLPSGFCFALQAVNTSNDSLAAFFVLAAFFYALRGKTSMEWTDFALSILCMALATGVKLNLLSFGLAWIVAASAGWKKLLSRPAMTTATVLLAALVSFVPTGFFNWSHGRGWTGLASDNLPPLGANFICTIFHLLAQNAIPPLLGGKYAGPVQIPEIEGSKLGQLMDQYYHTPVYYSQVAVEQAGLGFIVVLLLAMLFLTTEARPPQNSDDDDALISRRSLIFGALFLAFFHFLFFVNTDQPARLICPFYLLLLPAYFAGRSLRKKIPWRTLKMIVGAGMLTGLYLALFLTENSLFGFMPFFDNRRHWEEKNEELVQELIPDREKSVGIIRFYNEREAWLWRPYGSRKVIQLPINPDPARLQKLGIHYIAISDEMLAINHLKIQTWLIGRPWTLIGADLTYRDSSWYFVEEKK
jgi:hypothetical protein